MNCIEEVYVEESEIYARFTLYNRKQTCLGVYMDSASQAAGTIGRGKFCCL